MKLYENILHMFSYNVHLHSTFTLYFFVYEPLPPFLQWKLWDSHTKVVFCFVLPSWLTGSFFSQRHPEIRGFHQNDESNVALLWHKLCPIHTFVPHQGACIKGTSLCQNNTMLLLSFAYPPQPTLQMPLPPLFLLDKNFSQLEKKNFWGN